MEFIFDEFIEIEYKHDGATWKAYVSASDISSIEVRSVDTCNIMLGDTAYYTHVMCSASVMKHRVEEARKRQAIKFDKVIMALINRRK